MDFSMIYAHATGVASRQIDGEALLVDLQRSTLQVLNPVGARLWDLIDGRRTVAELAQVLHAEYAVSLEQARADVQAFCEDLLHRNMLTVAERLSGI
jgi:hypothetical protein